ncbi:hypothetical protein TVAG_163720 [Trichomonas vaginalis G3]|uniref:E2F/DP family winged-helix DNA-binding domain-containing protein n=1 Tax=Trichomonas vaginalis (strain ATCC PRA-98 / G3) TaxID=412133 RepID=A2DG49_TRIV3|nr:transcription factor DP family [Trichomonas vaginalis G3]EAY20676.1 hypothetical protein TVAG_163720 [Trichomonas vaginalis G3]KAI5487397.1 transcription factor DP family [Trichomonas vaginalis G3]|eukprot:XP_001581662.1 hypothetical protein [Trichomonas vaginalis G3]
MSDSKDKICLKAIAPRLLELMRSMKSTTSETIATMLINLLAVEAAGSFSQETVRRRIYDVINVLSATGVIEKDGKKLTWRGLNNPNAPSQDPSQNVPPSLLMKERNLHDKLRLLAAYKALIRKNFPQVRPSNGLPARVIIFGTTCREIQASKEEDHEIKIEMAHKPSCYFSPADIIARIPFSYEEIQSVFEANAYFKKYAKEVLAEMYGIPE